MRATETVRCPVCRGAGFKGNGLWNILSDCPVCAGTGRVEAHARRAQSRDLWVEFCREEESREVRS